MQFLPNTTAPRLMLASCLFVQDEELKGSTSSSLLITESMKGALLATGHARDSGPTSGGRSLAPPSKEDGHLKSSTTYRAPPHLQLAVTPSGSRTSGGDHGKPGTLSLLPHPPIPCTLSLLSRPPIPCTLSLLSRPPIPCTLSLLSHPPHHAHWGHSASSTHTMHTGDIVPHPSVPCTLGA
jgi:hypothetical protein